jgi:hypothetical protein
LDEGLGLFSWLAFKKKHDPPSTERHSHGCHLGVTLGCDMAAAQRISCRCVKAGADDSNVGPEFCAHWQDEAVKRGQIVSIAHVASSPWHIHAVSPSTHLAGDIGHGVGAKTWQPCGGADLGGSTRAGIEAATFVAVQRDVKDRRVPLDHLLRSIPVVH